MGRPSNDQKELWLMKIRGRIKYCLIAVILLTVLSCTRPPLPPPIVLFDQGHGQQFLIERNKELDLSKLAQIFRDNGFDVQSSNQPLTNERLKDVSTLIISGPFVPFNSDEVDAIRKYLNEGGQLCIMLHITPPVIPVFDQLGVAVSNGVIRERENLLPGREQTDFSVTDIAPHPLTRDLNRINFFGAWALNTQLEANVIAKTSPAAWIDLNGNQNLEPGDAVQQFSVIITGQLGHGHFIVFGDDAIFQNRFLQRENEMLARNMAKWLKSGSYYR